MRQSPLKRHARVTEQSTGRRNTALDAQFATILGASLAAVAAIWVGVYPLWRQARLRTKTAFAALFAELAHIERHYKYSAYEVENPPPYSVELRLQFAKYGTMAGSVHLRENSILGAQQIAEVLQLALFIRNTDLLLDDHLLKQGPLAD